MAKFDCISAMESDGIQRCGSHGGWETDRFRFREVGNDIQVGIKKHFDRWANSVDFVFSKSKTEKAYRKVMDRLDRAMKVGNYSKGWGNETRL